MGITYNSVVHDVVQEAFNLLRQDFAAPTVASPAVEVDAVSDSSNEWLKAKFSLKTAAAEVFYAFEWGSSYSEEGIGDWPKWMRSVLVYVLARELAIPVAGRTEDMKIYASLAQEKLRQAVVKCTNNQLADDVRLEILAAHDWNWATRTDVVGGVGGSALSAPFNAIRIVGVFGVHGLLQEWHIENGRIEAREPIAKIKYIVDVAVDKWPITMRSIYNMRMNALSGRYVMSSAREEALQEQRFRKALEDAKMRDAREDNWNYEERVDDRRGLEFGARG